MITSLSIETTSEVGKKLSIIYSLSEAIERKLFKHDYGMNVLSIWIVFNCCEHGFGEESGDFMTGTVIHKKLNRSKKALQLDIKLNHAHVMAARNKIEVIEIVKEGINGSIQSVEEMNISDFDHKKFYSDLMELINEFEKKGMKNTGQVPISDVATDLPIERMNEDEFWKIIMKAKKVSRDLSENAEFIKNELSTFSEHDIIGFEITFRSLINNAYTYNVLALAKIVDGFVTDDSFLYFRAKLILFGKDIYQQTLSDPNLLSGKLDEEFDGEEVLTLSDEAFLIKKGESYEYELPSDIAEEVLDYDSNLDELKGEKWDENDFQNKFSKIQDLYDI